MILRQALPRNLSTSIFFKSRLCLPVMLPIPTIAVSTFPLPLTLLETIEFVRPVHAVQTRLTLNVNHCYAALPYASPSIAGINQIYFAASNARHTRDSTSHASYRALKKLPVPLLTNNPRQPNKIETVRRTLRNRLPNRHILINHSATPRSMPTLRRQLPHRRRILRPLLDPNKPQRQQNLSDLNIKPRPTIPKTRLNLAVTQVRSKTVKL